MTRSLKEDGTVSGWRNELYPVTTNFTTQPLLLMERAAAVHFGIKVQAAARLLQGQLGRLMPALTDKALCRHMGCTSTASSTAQRAPACGLHAEAQPSPHGLASWTT